MRHRVALVGDPDWLTSDRLAAVLHHPRIARAATSTVDHFRLDLPAARRADILLMQFAAAFDRSLAIARSATSAEHTLRCIAVTRTASDDMLRCLVSAGIWGQVLESADAREYCQAIFHVGAGRLAYPPGVLDRIQTSGGRMWLAEHVEHEAGLLSVQQQTFVRLLADGLTTRQAAVAMGIEPDAALRLRKKLMYRLRLGNQAALVRFAIRSGLVTP